MGKHGRFREAAGLDPLVSLPTGAHAYELVDDGPVWTAVQAQLFSECGDQDVAPEDWDEIREAGRIMDTPGASGVMKAAAAARISQILEKYDPDI